MNELEQKEKESFVKREARDASYYLVIGLTAMAMDVSVFYLLNKQLDIFAVWANTMSVSLATFFGFFANQKYNFKVKDNLWKRFFSYAFVSILGLGLGNIFIYLMSNVFHYDAFLAKLISLPVVVGLQYLANRFVSFNKESFSN